MVQWMVAVVVAGFTIDTLVPFSYKASCITLLLQDSCKRGFVPGESAGSRVPLEGTVPIIGFHA